MTNFKRLTSPKNQPLVVGEALRRNILAYLPCDIRSLTRILGRDYSGIRASLLAMERYGMVTRENVVGRPPGAPQFIWHRTDKAKAPTKQLLPLRPIDPRASMTTPRVDREDLNDYRSIWTRPVYTPPVWCPPRVTK